MENLMRRVLAILFFFGVFVITTNGYSQAPQDPDKRPVDPRNNPKAFEPSDHYVHDWEPVKPMVGDRVGVSGTLEFEPQKGHMSVLIFLAPWNEPSQNMMHDLQKLEKKYAPLAADFVYVFAHTTPEDAEGFYRHFNLSRAMMANDDIMKTYHVDHLPTIYVGDKYGWLTKHHKETTLADVKDLGEYLKKQTAF
jgi:thiol-disulfide isomerase/thioredoxin